MNIAIIGAGFTGLTAAYELGKYGHHVTLFEKEKTLGGLAQGFKEKNWEWYLEGAYHHLFTNDSAIIGLIKELGLTDKLIVKRPITATYWQGKIYQLDSPFHLLTFPGLPLADRLRTGTLLAALKINPFWQPLERVTAYKFFRFLGGEKSWDILWEPLMAGKFGDLSQTIATSWLWARVKKRTSNLCYVKGGFHTLVSALEKAIKHQGGQIHTRTEIKKLSHGFMVSWLKINETMKQSNHEKFDRVLLTVPSLVATKLITFPKAYIQQVSSIPHLHAQTLILETREPILQGASQPHKVSPCEANPQSVYWLNICDRSFPFLAVVAHTNFMDKKHYGGHHITYFGNYLPSEHRYLSMTKERLLKEFMTYIRLLNQQFNNKTIQQLHLFTGAYAQPIHQLHYSGRAPKLQTPIAGLFLANLDSIYPWDRGTNYAVELGTKAAEKILSFRP